jgi:hypothetical protein
MMTADFAKTPHQSLPPLSRRQIAKLLSASAFVRQPEGGLSLFKLVPVDSFWAIRGERIGETEPASASGAGMSARVAVFRYR